MSEFRLEQYVRRIGFQGTAEATLACVVDMMHCQVMTVPFENLDIQDGKIISLNPGDIVDKLIARRRGGYCFEVNGLFSMALQALQIPHFFIAASPRTHHNVRKPKTHMAVVVQLAGQQWLCDCGFGGYGLRAPICIDRAGVEVSQDGEQFRLSLNHDNEFELQTKVQDVWETQYGFDLAPHPWADFAAANYYNSTHHDSLFVRKLLVVICTPNGRKVLFGNTLKIVENGQQFKSHLTPDNRAEILWREFGLTLSGQ